MLERLGVNVILAEDGREAVEVFRARHNEIDCVLLDLTMPNLDGEEAFKEMKEIRNDVRVILSSGYRSSRVQAARLNLEKVKTASEQLKAGLTIKVQTAKSEFNNAYLLKLNKQKSMEAAEKIYIKTAIKYREGMSTSLELLQAHNQFLSNESEYMLTILAMMNAKLTLEKLLTTF